MGRSDGTQSSDSTGMTQGSGKKMAFSEFAKQGGSYQCTVNQNIAGMQSTGLVFMNNNMVKTEFKTNVSGYAMENYVLMRDGFVYAWTNTSPMGSKMKVEATQSGTPESSGQYSYLEGQQIGDYECKPWSGDDSKFTIPTSITFSAVGSLN